MSAAAAATAAAVAGLTLGNVLGPSALLGVVLTIAAVYAGAFRLPGPIARLRR